MSLEVGQIVKGRVVNIKNFGAFVNLEDKQTGMIHISEVSDGFVKDINDYLAVGDEVQVKVIKVTPDGKVNLSLRAVEGQAGEKETAEEAKEPARSQAQETFPTHTSPTLAASKKPLSDDFDKMMGQFLKDSEERLGSLRRSTESKRGGRGGRRG